MPVYRVIWPAGAQDGEDCAQELAADRHESMHLVLASSGALVEVRAIGSIVADRDDSQEPDRAARVAIACCGQGRMSHLVHPALRVGRAPAEMGHELFGGPIATGVACFGDIGLTGRLRPASQSERRLAECAKLGFVEAIVPDGTEPRGKISLTAAETLRQAITAGLNASGSSTG